MDDVVTSADVEEPVVTPVVAPVDAPVVVAQPRPLDTIHTELQNAIVAHKSALAALQASKTAIPTLIAEYKAAITWFSEDVKIIEADADTVVQDVESWVKRLVEKIV